ncbi:MAG: IPT/TIG domain-containing protein [Polyangiaceae bacterium]|jgi:hypothetical protein|nr:IPT/TIG domain-containing protein [Polyangiaceae bacterium]
MAAPVLLSIQPAQGPTSGGDVVLLRATHLAPRVRVSFGSVEAQVLVQHEEIGAYSLQVRTPAHPDGVVAVRLENLNAIGVPIPGEAAVLAAAYRYRRPVLAQEATLTRLVRQLLRELKRQVLENVSLSVNLDFDDTPEDGLDVIVLGKLPSLVLTGPRLRPNRFYASNVPVERVVASPSGLDLQRQRPPLTVDVEFSVTGASTSTIELLNLSTSLAAFFNRTRWLKLLRDPEKPEAGTVRWEMDALGELRTDLDGKDSVRAFSWGLVVRGFDLDEGLPLDLGRAVSEAGGEVSVFPIGGNP